MGEAMTRRRFVALGATAAGVVAAGGAAKLATTAPEIDLPAMKMGEGQMKTLVVYATKSGCTAGVGEKVAETLAGRDMEVDLKPAEEAGDPAAYDAVVVGSGVRVGSWHEPARTWVAEHAEALKARPVAFFTCCLTLANEPKKADEVRAYTDALIAETGVTPIDIGLFAGWNEPKRFSFVERTVLKLMKAPQGDFRDFDAIAAWADRIALRLGSRERGAS